MQKKVCYVSFSNSTGYSHSCQDKPPKRQKTPNKSHVPNTNHIPQQLQFITSPLQQQLSQQPQPHQLVLPMAIVTPPKQQVLQLSQDSDPSNPNVGAPVSSLFFIIIFWRTIHILNIFKNYIDKW